LRRFRIPEAVPAEDVAEALARAPEDLIELHVCQLQRLSNRGPRLFMEVVPFQHLTVTLHGQMAHEFANVFRQLLMVEALLEGERLVLEIREQLAVVVVPP
jgi:hypothetical protein